MPYVIEIFTDNDVSQGFLSYVDFEMNGPGYPTGDAQCTPDPRNAIQFRNHDEAWGFIFTRSQTCPHRPDGKPNRPLTALNCLIRRLENINDDNTGTEGAKSPRTS
jgi:hypothetical protein